MNQDPELVQITILVGRESISANMPKPPQQVNPERLLPLLYQIVDGEIQARCAEEAAKGKPISCANGCAACCRAQPVPITPLEVQHLMKVIEAMPPERQQLLRARFASNVDQLQQAGLVNEYFRPRHELSFEAALDIARRYIQLRLVCPFLENDSCSIYADRPFVCRQYLVRSDPKLCESPLAAPVDVLPLRLKPATAVLRTLNSLTGTEHATVPLTLLIEYARRHPAELDREFNAEAFVKSWLQALMT